MSSLPDSAREDARPSGEDTARVARHHLARRLGIAGAALGVVAGAMQATLGARIPAWTGDKLTPGRLGLLTVALSLLAGAAAGRQDRAGLGTGPRAACSVVLLATGLLCFSTVGRLWYLPGPLLLLGGALAVGSSTDTARLVAANWLRCLLGALGVAELLMAASAGPVLLTVGVIGGAALLAAGWLAPAPRALTGLTLLGALPFAALAWTAVVPVVLLLTASALAVALARHPAPTGPAAGGFRPATARRGSAGEARPGARPTSWWSGPWRGPLGAGLGGSGGSGGSDRTGPDVRRNAGPGAVPAGVAQQH